jgi:hypothetical protein
MFPHGSFDIFCIWDTTPKEEQCYLLPNQSGRVSMLPETYLTGGLRIEASLQNPKIGGYAERLWFASYVGGLATPPFQGFDKLGLSLGS